MTFELKVFQYYFMMHLCNYPVQTTVALNSTISVIILSIQI